MCVIHLSEHNNKTKQVSLAIRGVYVPEKYQTANTKICVLGPNKAILG